MDIRYVKLPGNEIFNQIGLEGRVVTMWRNDLPEVVLEYRNEVRELQVYLSNKVNGFYEKLEESILREGFRNPIPIIAGDTKKMKHCQHLYYDLINKSKDKWLIAEYSTGGSCLWVAQKNNLEIPCIVNDAAGRFDDHPLIRSEYELLRYFTDRPEVIHFDLESNKAVYWEKLSHDYMGEMSHDVSHVEHDNAIFTTPEDVEKIYRINYLAGGSFGFSRSGKLGYWKHVDKVLLKEMYPAVYDSIMKQRRTKEIMSRSRATPNSRREMAEQLRQNYLKKLNVAKVSPKYRKKSVSRQKLQLPAGVTANTWYQDLLNDKSNNNPK